MEPQLFIPYLPILLILIITLLILSLIKPSKPSPNLPPSPPKLPLIGNLHQLLFPLSSPPHHKLKHLSLKHGPLMHLQLGQLSTIIISSSHFAQKVMKTHDLNFASRPSSLATDIMFYNGTDIGFSPYGEYWRQLRKICTLELLSAKRVQSFRSIREEEMLNVVRSLGLQARSMVNLSERIRSLAYDVTSRVAFGEKGKDQKMFLKVLKEGVELGSGFNVSDLFPSVKLIEWISGIRSKLERVHKECDHMLENIINDHKRKRRNSGDALENDKVEDFVDVLLKVHEEDDGDFDFHLTINNVKAVILDVFTAGSETCATTIDWTMAELIKNPNVMKRVQAEVREVIDKRGGGEVDETAIHEMKLLKLAIKETLRLHPPIAMLLPRECGENCVIDGFDIPAKTKVIVNAWAIGRNPEYWNEPDSFIPERFINSNMDYKGTHLEYIPFGAGRRICPGITFGMASIELPLAMLLYHFDWKLADRMEHEDLDMSESFGVSVRRKQDLCLIPIPYCPSIHVQ